MILDDVSFAIPPGRIVALLGQNGAGKTTTLRLMLSLDNGSGKTLFNGKRYQELRYPARTVGVMLDTVYAYPKHTACRHLAVIAAGAGLPTETIAPALDSVGLSTSRGPRVGDFSLGMRQRLSLAAALLGEPRILVLDEPGNGLDPFGREHLSGLLLELTGRGCTILLSSHDLDTTAGLADDILLLDGGKLRVQTTLKEFLTLGAGGVLRVRSDDPAHLAQLIERLGGVVLSVTRGRYRVSGLRAETLARSAQREKLLVTELFEDEARPDEAFRAALKQTTDGTASTVSGAS